MTLPNYWAEPSFAVAEVAELIGTPEVTLRSYLARCPEGDFLGNRDASRRVHLSCRQAFYYMLVSELSEYGVPVRSAMHAAAGIARTDPSDMESLLVVRSSGGVSEFSLTNERPADDRPALVLPIRALAEVLIEDAAIVYATEEVGPIRKIGTVDGYPIAEWREGIEDELARMPVNQ